jgi:hypothetical protein
MAERAGPGQIQNLGAPVKRASTRAKVPPVQLDGSVPQSRDQLRRREAEWGAGMESNPATAGSQYI